MPAHGVAALLCLLLCTGLPAIAASSAGKKQAAAAQFEKAEKMREALNGRPESERTRRDYQNVADAYRKVYYVAPASSKADASVVAVAELLAEMGRQFQPGEKDLQSAIKEYEFLCREYPGSKYRLQALFTIGQIYKEDLDNDAAARNTFEEYLKRYPRSSLAREAKQALADLKKPKTAAKPVEEVGTPPSEAPAVKAASQPEAQKKSALLMVTGVRHWSTPDYTRVAIDLEGEVKYEAGRVSKPDRIFFDLADTRLASVLVGKSFDVQDGFLKKIRVAQYHPGDTRVVLEVADVSDYSAFLLPNPYRLIIDIHGRQSRSPTELAKLEKSSASEHEEPPTNGGEQKSSETPSAADGKIMKPPTGGSAGTTPPSSSGSGAGDDIAMSRPASKPQPAASRPPRQKVTVDEDDNVTTGDIAVDTTGTRNPQSSPAKGTELKATRRPTTAPTAVAVAPRNADRKKSAKGAAGEMASAREAAPTSAGERSLTRALGLKIGRIVIDAGHGGHDTGTIGPNGLMEKDLVLDVALRLGRLLETRLGADVIFTRDDDTFIPLETRTAIANEHQADLFISVHANSSDDPSARGIETYYLNFTSNPDALEVAARENAVSEKSIFELQDLVKKITLRDKIEESRELASDVQQSMCSNLAGKHSTLRDRGVKKAPFVVLIGANMPSVLAEISFVSNPTDAAKLETPEYREKIADSLYKGVAKYVGGLSGVKVASKLNKSAGE